MIKNTHCKNRSFIRPFLLCCLLAFSWSGQASNSGDTLRWSLLTCSPGPELYSVFGHSALRATGSMNDRQIDVVFNYGTFAFSDDFYWKFVRGKLDYLLSVSDFYEFQPEYIETGRAIFEQHLQLSHEESSRLWVMMAENSLPQNRSYRYDFFYDNCSSRIRDMVVKATEGRVQFTYVPVKSYTFRETIQNYLDFMPWSDFGIDLALGLPCDKIVAPGEEMFLPDSLMKSFHFAILGDGALVTPWEELLPAEFELHNTNIFTPIRVMSLYFLLTAIVGWLAIKRKQSSTFLDRLLLLLSGIIGLFLMFLWFLTDHEATKWNLNLLWANPLNAILAFLSFRQMSLFWKIYLKAYTFILLMLVVGWFFLPQKLHLATFPLVLGLLFFVLRQVRPGMFGIPVSFDLASRDKSAAVK